MDHTDTDTVTKGEASTSFEASSLMCRARFSPRKLVVDLAPLAVTAPDRTRDPPLPSCIRRPGHTPPTDKQLRFSSTVHVRFYLSRPIVNSKGVSRMISNITGKLPLQKRSHLKGRSPRKCLAKTEKSYLPSKFTSVRRRLKSFGDSLVLTSNKKAEAMTIV